MDQRTPPGATGKNQTGVTPGLIRRHRLASNRLVWAGLAGTLVWFADQPTVHGYNPLFEMFWNPGFCNMPNWDLAVLLLSWLITTLFCHVVLFAFQKRRQQALPSRERQQDPSS